MKKLVIVVFLITFWTVGLSGQYPDRAYDKGLFKEAEEGYHKALKESPESAPLLYNLGNATYRQGEYQIASKLYEQALTLSGPAKNKADAWHNLGNARFNQKDYAGAVQAYQNSLRYRPGDQASKNNLFLAKKNLKQQQIQEDAGKDAQPEHNDAQNDEAERPEGAGTTTPDPKNRETAKTDDARRYLESVIEREDQRNTRKYRSGEQRGRNILLDKDW